MEMETNSIMSGHLLAMVIISMHHHRSLMASIQVSMVDRRGTHSLMVVCLISMPITLMEVVLMASQVLTLAKVTLFRTKKV